MAIADKLTTREALRRAVADDILTRADLVAETIGVADVEGIEGVRFVSMGKLRDQVSGHLMVDLGAPSDQHAEVSTPATILVSAKCPECALPVEISVKLTPALAVDNDGAELKVKAKSKGRPHVHGQLSLPEESTAEGQVGMDEVLGDVVIDDLRLRILRAIADVSDAYANEIEPGPPPSLDAIAIKLEVINDSDRGDLEESLYAYSQLEEPLVEVVSEAGVPPTYVLTDAGISMVEAADAADAAEAGDVVDVEITVEVEIDETDPDDAP